MAIGANPSKLNPLIATDSTSSTVASHIFNSLITYDKNAKIKCELAKSYRFLDDTTLEFVLRDDIKWTDGVGFSADDVVFTYELITSPKVLTPYASSFRYVKSVKKIDKYKIVVKYKEPYFKALETWMMSIVPKHKLENEKDVMTSKFNQSPIGTGSYTLNKLVTGADTTLVANSDYFEHKPKIDKITYHFIPDPTTQFLFLKAKKLDVGGLSPLQLEKEIDSSFRDYYSIYEDISHSYTYMGFNLKSEKFKNKKIREAISLAIDRQEMVDILFFGHGRVCTGPFLPNTLGFNDNIKVPKRDIKKAKEILKSLGYDENNPFEFTVVTNANNSQRVNAAQIMQHQLASANIKMKIRIMEWQAFLNTVVHPRKFEAVLLGWSMSLTPDAYSIWHSDNMSVGKFNFVSYKNERVDTLIKKAEKTVDKKEFGKMYEEIFDTIVNDYPYLFLYIPNSITAVNKKIKNVEPSIIGIQHNLIDWEKDN
jgi:peptide/nickel transport system substrate-binding protein